MVKDKLNKISIKKIRFIFAGIMFFSGIGIMLYPYISNKIAEKNSSQAIQEMTESLNNMDQEKLDAAKEAAKAFNEQLNNVIVRDETLNNETGTSYVDMLGIGESIGYITIPKIDVELPIYEGTNEDVLSKGVGHMENTSYPIGGESTHSVLTGHRGLPTAVLFTDLDQMAIDDQFYLHVLGETLAYKVDSIVVVEPNDSSHLNIIQGQDYCTLVTCTPYAINTHRLLVRGIRTEYIEEDANMNVQYQELRTGTIVRRLMDVWPWLIVAGSVVLGSEIALMMALINKKKQEDDDE